MQQTGLPPQYDVNPCEDQLQILTSQPTGALAEQRVIKGDNESRLCDRILG